MGQFAHVLHMPPREVELLTAPQFDALADWLGDYERQMKEASRG